MQQCPPPKALGEPIARMLTSQADAARRDLLPDVEEINSTLRPSEMPRTTADEARLCRPSAEARAGFAAAFSLVMTVAILGAAIYLLAPRLAVMVPALAGPLEGYVGVVDSLRLGAGRA